MNGVSMFQHMQRGLKLVATGAALAAIAGCAQENAEGPQAQATPAAASSQPEQTGANAQNQIRMAKCATNPQGAIHFKIGQSVLQVPSGVISDAIPSGMTPPLKKEAVQKELQARAAAGAGCPEQPLDATLLLLKADLGHPLLEGSMGLLQSPPGEVTKSFAKLTRQLQEKPNKNCKALGSELIGCLGTETRGERKTPVMYVISTDTSLTMNSGGPLAARCILGEEKVQGCNIVDHLPGRVTFDVTLRPGDYSSAGLRAAREAAIASIDAMRL